MSAFITFSQHSTTPSVWSATFAHGCDLLCLRCKMLRGDVKAEKIILCDECNVIRPHSAFSDDMQRAWHAGPKEPIYCKCCLKEGRSISKADMSFCNGRCQANRPDYQFLEEALVAVMAGTDQPQQRMCVHCYMQDRKDLSEAKVYKCNACGQRKHLRDFSPYDQKEWLKGGRNYCRWVCYDCRFPQCETCKTRPLHAVKHNAYIDGKYYCIGCKYPPCAGGCRKRPKSTKYRFKAWTCEGCQKHIHASAVLEAVPEVVQPAERRQDSNSMSAAPCDEARDWSGATMSERSSTTLNNAMKSCDNCGVKQSLQSFRREKNGDIAKFCRTCQLPQCASCGHQRTEEQGPLSKKEMATRPWYYK